MKFTFLFHYLCAQSYFSKCSALTHFIKASNLNLLFPEVLSLLKKDHVKWLLSSCIFTAFKEDTTVHKEEETTQYSLSDINLF